MRTTLPWESEIVAVAFCAGLLNVTLDEAVRLPVHCKPLVETVTVLPTRSDALELVIP